MQAEVCIPMLKYEKYPCVCVVLFFLKSSQWSKNDAFQMAIRKLTNKYPTNIQQIYPLNKFPNFLQQFICWIGMVQNKDLPLLTLF